MNRIVNIYLKGGQTVAVTTDAETAQKLIKELDNALLNDVKMGRVSFGTPLGVTLRMEDISGAALKDNS